MALLDFAGFVNETVEPVDIFRAPEIAVDRNFRTDETEHSNIFRCEKGVNRIPENFFIYANRRRVQINFELSVADRLNFVERSRQIFSAGEGDNFKLPVFVFWNEQTVFAQEFKFALNFVFAFAD